MLTQAIDPSQLVERFWEQLPALTGLPAPSELAEEISVEACVNWGRWLAGCPFCSGSELVSVADPRFACLTCGHRDTVYEGLWIPVLFPVDFDAIEAALEGRAVPNRNWLPGETLERLAADNAGAARWDAVVAHRAGQLTDEQLEAVYADTADTIAAGS